MLFQQLAIVVGFVSALLFAIPFIYLFRPRYKFLIGGAICLIALSAFAIGLYYLYMPFPFPEGLRSYDSFKSYYVGLFGLLWGFLLAIPGLVFLALVVALVNALSSKKSPSFGQSRRTLLKGLALCIPLASMGTSLIAAKRGEENLVLKEETFSFKNLPEPLKNYRIVQISDTHIGAFIDFGDFDNVVSKILGQRPNRLVITGDLIDDLDRLPGLVKRLNALAPLIPDGIDYIYGNHEHFRNYRRVKEYLAQTPMRILDNRNEKIFDGPSPVYIAGVNYDLERELDVRKAYMAEAMEGIPKGAFTILLAHHPEFFDLALNYDIPLTLAGHTHGGQVVLAGESFVPLGTPYIRGRYEKDGKYCYVNSGTGHWYPVRVNCPREITLITFAEA